MRKSKGHRTDVAARMTVAEDGARGQNQTSVVQNGVTLVVIRSTGSDVSGSIERRCSKDVDDDGKVE